MLLHNQLMSIMSGMSIVLSAGNWAFPTCYYSSYQFDYAVINETKNNLCVGVLKLRFNR